MSFQSPSAPICLLVKILSPVLISGNSYSCTLRIYPQQINGATDNYTVSNVSPNFWVSNYSGGLCWKINSISNVNTQLQTLDCVIEDVEYYNYSLDVTVGQHGPSDNINGYCFQLGDNGLPNLVPIYSNTFTISQTFISDLTARFNSRNYSTSYISVLQNGHSFVKGNFIGLNVSTGAYVLATSSITYLEIIGVVTSIGIPTVNHFTFRPFGQYLKASEIPTALTQGVGSIYYLDSSGNLTITNTYDSNPVYIQVSSGGDGILLKYRSPSLRTAYLNNIQGSTTTQSISLFSSTVSPATISFGNTGGDTLTINPPVTSNGSVTLAANKTLTLNSTGGKVLSNVLTGTTTSSAMTIGESGDTSTVTINKDAVLASGKTLTLNSTGGKVLTNVLTGTATSSAMTIGESGDTSTVTINKDAVLASGKTLTLNSTGGKVLTNVLTGTATSSAMTIGESGDTSTVTINKDAVLASGKTLTLNSTGGKVLTNVLTGTTTSSNLTLGESGDTGNLSIFKTINTNINLGTGNQILFTSTGQMTINTIRGVLFADAISLYLSQTGNISFGNNLGTGGGITFNDNITLPSNRTITLNSTGGKVLTNVLTGTSTSSAITIGESGDTSTVTINKDAVLASGKTLTLNSTGGKVLTNVLTGTSTSSAITIGESGDTSTVTINKDAVLASGKTLTLNSTGGKVICNTLEGTAAGSAVSLFGTTTSTIALGNVSGGAVTINPAVTANGSITLASGKTITLNSTGGKVLSNVLTGTTTSSAMTIGESGDTSTVTINKDAVLASGKTLTLNSTGGKVLTNVLTGTSTSSAMTIGESGDTGNLTLNKTLVCQNISSRDTGTNMEIFNNHSAQIAIGSLSNGYNLVFNQNVYMQTNKNITLNGTGKVLTNVLTGTSTSSAITIGESGDTSTVTINKDAVLASGKTLTLNSTGGKVLTNVLTGTSTSSAMTIGESGDTSTVTINKDTVLGTNKNLTLSAGTGKVTTPGILVSGLTASKLVLTDASDNLVSSSYTDSDFPRITANNTLSGINTFTGGLLTSTTNQVSNLNNGELIRSLFRFYTPNYQSVGQDAATNPQTLSTTSVNGSVYVNGAWSPNAYVPAADGSIPHGQPYYFRNNATLTLTFATDRTNLTSSISLASNKVIIFMYNSNTTLYEFVGIVNDTSIPTSNQFNSRINSFTLPTTRGTNNSILTSDGSGGATWATSVLSSTFNSTSATQALTIGGSNTTASITIGGALTSGAINLGLIGMTGGIFMNSDVSLPANKTITLNSTGGKVLTNVLTGTATSSAMTIGESGDTSTVTINKDAVLASGKTLTLNSTGGKVICNTLEGTAVGSAVSLFGTTTSTIALGNVSGGAVTINPAVTANGSITLASGKTITLNSTGGSVLSPTFNSTSATQALTIGGSNTTAPITIGGALTSGAINLGLIGMTGGIFMNSDVSIGTSSTNKGLVCNYLSTFNNSDLLQVGAITTTGEIRIGGNITTGNVNISNVASTGLTTIGGKVRLSKASTTREMWFNTGSGTTLFSSIALSNKQLSSNIYTSAPTEDFSIWESNAYPLGNDASFIAQNGSATIICNPGDAQVGEANYSLFWIDEDDMTTASNWTVANGWKISVTGSLVGTSDARTKHNIQTIDKAEILDKLENIDIVSFQKIRPPHVTRETKKYDCVHRGYTAQDLQANGFDEVVTADESGTLSVNYSDMNLYWFSGVQKLIKQNKEQQKQIDEQKLLIDNLTTRLARLEQILGI